MMERNHHVTNLGLPPSDDILDQYNVSFALLDRMPVVLLPLFVSGLVYQKASGPEKEKKQQFATVSFAWIDSIHENWRDFTFQKTIKEFLWKFVQ